MIKNNGRWKEVARTLFARKVAMVGAVVVVPFIAVAILALVISSYDPSYVDFASFPQGPGSAHLLGMDNYGRDVLSRIICGTRMSLIIGVSAIIIACIIDAFFGMIVGYFGGIVDSMINRIMEAIRTIPWIILVMALTATFGSSIRNLTIILGTPFMMGYVRMMRGQMLTIEQADYIMARKFQGSKNFRPIFKHIPSNSISPIIVMMAQQVGQTILAEASLNFLGLGISALIASWGSMVSEGRLFLLRNPAFALTSGVCVAVLTICLNTSGGGIRDVLDPRLRDETQEEIKGRTLVGDKKY